MNKLVVLLTFLFSLSFTLDVSAQENLEGFKKISFGEVCDNYSFYVKKGRSSSIVKYFELSSSTWKTKIVETTVDVKHLSYNILSQARAACQIASSDIGNSYTCVQDGVIGSSAHHSEDLFAGATEVVASIENDFCRTPVSITHSFSELEKLKFSLLQLFGTKEYSIIKDSVAQCGEGSLEDIVLNYILYKAQHSCMKEKLNIADVKSVFKSYLKEIKDTKGIKRATAFKKLGRNLYEGLQKVYLKSLFKESFSVAPSKQLEEKFNNYLLFSNKKKNLRIDGETFKLPEFQRKYGQEIVQAFINEHYDKNSHLNFIHSSGMELNNEQLTQSHERVAQCLKQELSTPNISTALKTGREQKLISFYKLSKEFGSREATSCEPDTRHKIIRKKCLDKETKNLLMNTLWSSLLEQVGTRSNVEEIIGETKSCLENLNSSLLSNSEKVSLCLLEAKRNYLVKRAKTEIQAFYTSEGIAARDQHQALQLCLNDTQVIRLDSASCVEKVKSNIIAEEFFKQIDNVAGDIKATYKNCIQNTDVNECISRALNSIQADFKQTQIREQFPKLASKSFGELMSKGVSPLKASAVIIDRYTNIAKPEYNRNDASDFCKRDVRIVDTIVFHHTETPTTTSAQDINRFHTNNSWHMIGYQYLIHNFENTNQVDDVTISQGRPIEMTGAHAGHYSRTINYPPELLDRYKETKLLCGFRNGEFPPKEEDIEEGQIKANAATIAIAFVGNFAKLSSYNPTGHPGPGKIFPSEVSLKRAAKLMCSIQQSYPSVKNVKWHSLYKATECPGWIVEKINKIKQLAKEYGCEFY